MKISCDRYTLANAMGMAIRAVPKNSVTQIQKCVLVEADSSIKITANDNELTIRTEISGMVLEKGAVAIPATLLNEISRKMPDGDVYLESDENDSITISCGKSKFHIAGMDGSNFVGMPAESAGSTFTVNAVTFADAINRIIFCTAKDSTTNPMTSGINFQAKDGVLALTALDGHRIARKTIKIDSTDDFETTIPAKSLSEVTKIFKDGNITVSISKNTADFKSDDAEMVSRTLYVKYFDVQKFIDGIQPEHIMVNRLELRDVINRATIVIKETERKPVVFGMQDNTLTVSAATTVGTSNESVDIEQSCPDMRIGFNPRFLLEALSAVDEEAVQINLTTPKSPAIIGTLDDGYIYVVLPVAI